MSSPRAEPPPLLILFAECRYGGRSGGERTRPRDERRLSGGERGRSRRGSGGDRRTSSDGDDAITDGIRRLSGLQALETTLTPEVSERRGSRRGSGGALVSPRVVSLSPESKKAARAKAQAAAARHTAQESAELRMFERVEVEKNFKESAGGAPRPSFVDANPSFSPAVKLVGGVEGDLTEREMMARVAREHGATRERPPAHLRRAKTGGVSATAPLPRRASGRSATHGSGLAREPSFKQGSPDRESVREASFKQKRRPAQVRRQKTSVERLKEGQEQEAKEAKEREHLKVAADRLLKEWASRTRGNVYQMMRSVSRSPRRPRYRERPSAGSGTARTPPSSRGRCTSSPTCSPPTP